MNGFIEVKHVVIMMLLMVVLATFTIFVTLQCRVDTSLHVVLTPSRVVTPTNVLSDFRKNIFKKIKSGLEWLLGFAGVVVGN